MSKTKLRFQEKRRSRLTYPHKVTSPEPKVHGDSFIIIFSAPFRRTISSSDLISLAKADDLVLSLVSRKQPSSTRCGSASHATNLLDGAIELGSQW